MPANGMNRSGWRSASPATSSFGMNVSCTLDHSSKPVISVRPIPAWSSSEITWSSLIWSSRVAAPNSSGRGSRL